MRFTGLGVGHHEGGRASTTYNLDHIEPEDDNEIVAPENIPQLDEGEDAEAEDEDDNTEDEDESLQTVNDAYADA